MSREIIQSNVIAYQEPYSYFLTFNVHSNPLKVLKQCATLPKITREISEQNRHMVTSTVGFGRKFWEYAMKVIPGKPENFKEMEEIRVEDRYAPATGGDVFLHINSGRVDLNYLVASTLLQPIKGYVTVTGDVMGYKYLAGLDLTGFIDGTKNPQTLEERMETAVIPSGKFAGGSFIFTQKWIHNLKKWEKVDLKTQEKIIGRTKKDSIQLIPLPKDSHVARNIIRNDEGRQLKIVRHSMPFGSGISGDSGLFFIAYTKDLNIIDALLQRMYGAKEGGKMIYDKLVDFSKAVTGAYFFAPSLEILKEIETKLKEEDYEMIKSNL